jgi:hypothetical protein
MSSSLRCLPLFGIESFMKGKDNKSREERLAEALRANLRRRKMPSKQQAQTAEVKGSNSDS